MFTTLRRIAGGTAVVPTQTPSAKASLKKTISCSRCGCPVRLARVMWLHGGGARGYYMHVCHGKQQLIAVVRNGVTRIVGSNAKKVFLS